MLLAASGGINSSFTAWDVWSESVIGNLAASSFSLGSDGSVAQFVTEGDAGGTPGSDAWFLPVTTGVGSLYYGRLTPTSGTFTSNTASTWTLLNFGATAVKSASSGSASVTFTIEIATDSGGSNIVFTSTGNVLRYSHF